MIALEVSCRQHVVTMHQGKSEARSHPMEMDAKFHDFARSGKYDEADAVRLRWVELSNPDPSRAAFWESFILESRKEYQKALHVLSKVIESGIDSCELCRIQRADIFILMARWQDSLADLNHIAASDDPIVVRSFRDGALFNRAYVLARIGSPEFLSAITKISYGAENFIVDRILKRQNLIEIYESMQC